MGDVRKKKARPWVDLIVGYGWDVLKCDGGPERDYEFLVGCWLNLDRTESRHTLRTFYAIQQSFQRVPDYRLFAASVDDPQLATHLWEREKKLAEVEQRQPHNPEFPEV